MESVKLKLDAMLVRLLDRLEVKVCVERLVLLVPTGAAVVEFW